MSFETYAKRFGIKQWVCEIAGPFCTFRVFTTGSPQHYIFVALDDKGIDHGLHIPVQKSRLRTDVARYISRQFRR